jgi:hypothetical protein
MGSILSFVAQYFLNWKIYLFVFLQSLATYFMPKTVWSKLFVFVYTFVFFTLLTSCPVGAWYASDNVKLKVSLFIILLYSIYTGIVPFNYPRKKYSYLLFQYIANLATFYLVYMFFELYFCKNFVGQDQVISPLFAKI